MRVDLTVRRSGDIGSPPLVRLDQRPQRRDQTRIRLGGPLARPPRPAQRLRPGLQLIDPERHRGLADPGGPGHQTDPATAQHPRLGAQQPAAAARSSRCGKTAAYFAASISPVTTSSPVPHKSAAFEEATGYFYATP